MFLVGLVLFEVHLYIVSALTIVFKRWFRVDIFILKMFDHGNHILILTLFSLVLFVCKLP